MHPSSVFTYSSGERIRIHRRIERGSFSISSSGVKTKRRRVYSSMTSAGFSCPKESVGSVVFIFSLPDSWFSLSKQLRSERR